MLRHTGTALFIALSGLLPAISNAQQAPDFSKIKSSRLGEDLYTLEGQGGTISVLIGPESVLLVDAQFAPLADKLHAAIRKLSDQPIRYLINTHVHGDHTGGNENFAKLGATPHFTKHDVLAVGDDYRSVGYPLVDLNNGVAA